MLGLRFAMQILTLTKNILLCRRSRRKSISCNLLLSLRLGTVLLSYNMFSRASCSVTRTIVSHPSSKIFSPSWEPQRALSIISIHSTFPASLLRFQNLKSSSLFDFSTCHGQECVLEDGITVSKDGLVYPTVSTDLPCANSRWGFNAPR